ncbi:MAG: hypothetical protein ACYCQJ_00495 [Nitrososphaerales archaeon]
MDVCKTCGSTLKLNERLSSSFSKMFQMEVKTYFCPSCLDDIYVMREEKLYTSKEWREKMHSA